MRSHRFRGLAGNAGGIPTDGLVSHYTMDTISGSTLVDETGAYDGTISGATQVSGLIGQALSFAGSDEVTLAGTASGHAFIQNTHQFHICAWVKHDNTDNDQLDVIAGSAISTTQKGFRFNFDDRSGSGFNRALVFATFKATGGNEASLILETNVTPGDGLYHFYEAWGDGSNVYIAIDLTQVGTSNVVANSTGSASNDTALGDIPGQAFGLNGDEDDVLFYNRPLTTAERQAIYDRGA